MARSAYSEFVRSLQPIQRLQFEVLIGAMNDSAVENGKSRIADLWIEGRLGNRFQTPDGKIIVNPFSFTSCCDSLSINPKFIRKTRSFWRQAIREGTANISSTVKRMKKVGKILYLMISCPSKIEDFSMRKINGYKRTVGY